MKSGISPASTWLSYRTLVLAGLLVFTLIVRGSVLWAMRSNLNQDADAYREIAENLLRHGEFAMGKPGPDGDVSKPTPTAYRPPLYSVVLSNLPAADGHHISLIKVAALHLVLGVATVWLTLLTAQRFIARNSRLAPLVAGLLVACDPILLNQQTLVMTETLAALLAVLSLWCLARFDQSRTWFNAALTGGAIGLAILCRPTFLPWLALVGLTMLFVHGRRSSRDSARRTGAPASRVDSAFDFGWRVANAAVLVIVAAAVLSPWAIRNYQVFGKPIVATTHGGYTLHLGNNEPFYEYLAKGDFELPWEASSLEKLVISKDTVLTEDIIKKLELLNAAFKEFEKEKQRRKYTDHPELRNDYIAYAFAKSWMREHPTEAAGACLYRLRQLWSPLPHKLTKDESTDRKLLRYATAGWYCGVYVLAAIGIWRLRWQLLQPSWIWGVLLCLVFTAVHTFYWTNLRMRAPLMPFIAMVAAAATISSKFQVPSSKLLNPDP
jgi:hypothetical protein